MASCKSPSLLLAAVLVTLFVSPTISQFYGDGTDPFPAKYGGDADPYSDFAASILDDSKGDPQYPNNIYCIGASDIDLCTWMVGGTETEPQQDAVRNAIKTTIRIAKKFEKIMPAVTKAVAQLPPPARLNVLKVCVQSYSDTMSKLQASLAAMPIFANVDSLLAQSVHKSCAAAINEQGLSVPAMNKYSNVMGVLIPIVMSVTQENE